MGSSHGPLPRCRRRSAAGPGSAPTPATSMPPWPTPLSSWAVTSQSPRNATPQRGGHFRPSQTATGVTLAGCTAGRSRRVTTPPRAGPMGPTQSSAGSRSASTSSATTRGRGAAGPSRKTNSPSPWVAPPITSGRSASSSRTSPPTTVTSSGAEAWFGNRTASEERFGEVKHSAGLHHLPSADPGVNSVVRCP